MTITAKFDSICPECRTPIQAGSKVEWNPGSKAKHVECPQVAALVPQQQRISVEDAGVYVMPDGGIVKVQANREKTRTYAKRWVEINGQRLTEADTRVQGEYQYEANLVQQVAATGRKMTLDEAKAFILRYGQCVRCSRKLVDANSVEKGIGPVCIKYFSAGTTGASLMAAPAEQPKPAPVGAMTGRDWQYEQEQQRVAREQSVPSFQCEHNRSNHCTISGEALIAKLEAMTSATDPELTPAHSYTVRQDDVTAYGMGYTRRPAYRRAANRNAGRDSNFWYR